MVAGLRHRQQDARVGCAELDGVADEVEQHLLDQPVVGPQAAGHAPPVPIDGAGLYRILVECVMALSRNDSTIAVIARQDSESARSLREGS
jgi:hypothetical protein